MDVNRVYQASPAPQVSTPPPAPVPIQGVDVPAPMPVQSNAPQAAPAAVSVEGYVRERTEVRRESEPLQQAVREINQSISSHGRHLNIRMHEATGRRLVTVYDSVTNDVLLELPPERVLDAHASVLEMVGLFMDTRG